MKFNVVKAPESYEIKPSVFSVFLAGAIDMGDAIDWQAEVTKLLKRQANNLKLPEEFEVTVLNPRRDDWSKDWEQTLENENFVEQLSWEHDGLENADMILLHYPKDSKAPITLLEMGLFASSGKLVVYCEEGYWRKGNVDFICNKYDIQTATSFQNMVTAASSGLRDKLKKYSVNKQIMESINGITK